MSADTAGGSGADRGEVLPDEAGVVRDRVEPAVDGPLYMLAAFDDEAIEPIHVAEEPRRETAGSLARSLGRLHGYFGLDFVEHDLLPSSLFPEADRVECRTRRFDDRTVVTGFGGETALLLIVGPDEPVDPLLAATSDVLRT